jgi:hypothetical protein
MHIIPISAVQLEKVTAQFSLADVLSAKDQFKSEACETSILVVVDEQANR